MKEESAQRLTPINLTQSGTLVLLLALLFLLDHGGHRFYGGLAFGLLAAYHLLTDYRYPPEQIRAAGLLAGHIAVYLLLCTLVIWATRGEEESPYWLIFLLPIAMAATQISLRGVLLTCASAAALLVGLAPAELFVAPLRHQEDLVEIAVSCLMFFVVGVLIHAFSEQNRRQLKVQRQLNDRLLANQSVLQESLQRLEAAEENLRRRDRLAALGEMSAGLAHEIRNPLGIISSSAQLLDGKVGDADPRAAGLLDIIQEETARLNGLVSDFLAFGRPAEPCRQMTDIKALVLRAVEPLRDMAVHKGVRVTAEFPPVALNASVDPDMLRQVLLNLLLNALDATPSGGEVVVALADRGERLEIEVRDSGCGIAQEHLPKIFNPFFTTKAQGTGLGLANAHRIIEAHNGEISVRSAPGKGSVFTVLLPVREV